MPHYRKKPVVIEAVQFDGSNYGECYSFCPTIFWEQGVGIIPTLEGEMRAQPNDWIIKGVKGEFYPCKPDIFAATYEALGYDPDAHESNMQWLKGQQLSAPQQAQGVPSEAAVQQGNGPL